MLVGFNGNPGRKRVMGMGRCTKTRTDRKCLRERGNLILPISSVRWPRLPTISDRMHAITDLRFARQRPACLSKGTMINFSVSRPPRALIFSVRRKKKKTSTVSMEGSVETASRPPFGGGCCSWRLFHFHADVIDHPRRM